MSRIRWFASTGVPVLLLAVVSACSNGSGSPGATPTSGSSTAATSAPASTSAATSAGASVPAGGGAVTVKGFAFSPTSLTVSVGTGVTWTNEDSAGHTVTADDGSFDSGTIPSGGTFPQTFVTAGTFTYHCAIHTGMTGTIVVS
jgi:hypothetical protein